MVAILIRSYTYTYNTQKIMPFRFIAKSLKYSQFQVAESVVEMWISHPSQRSEELLDYCHKATELCWLMCIQSPPVVMVTECNFGDHFDRNMFTEYTVRGTLYEYLVWPPLLLHKDGELLSKGVAQPMSCDS